MIWVLPGHVRTDEINLDEFERRLRAAGAQQARAEDPLAELSRLVEFSHLGISNGETAARRALQPAVARTEAFDRRSKARTFGQRSTPRWKNSFQAPRRPIARPGRTTSSTRTVQTGTPWPSPGDERRPRRWKIAVSALALAGVAMIGAVFALRGGVPGIKKDPPFIAAAQGPTKVAPPSDQTATTSSDAGAFLLKDNAKPGSVKVVNSEEQPVDLNAQSSVSNPPPAAADQAKPPASASDAAGLAAIINTPLVAPPAQPPQGMTSEFPDPKPVRTISLRPDGTPIGALPPIDQPASDPNIAAAARGGAQQAGGSAEQTRAEDDKRRGWRRTAVDAQNRVADQAFAAEVVGACGGRQNRYDRACRDRPGARRTGAS